MSLTLIIVAAIAAIWLAERSVEHLKLAIAALCFSAAVLLFVVTDFERAILLSSILAAAIFGASRFKYNHSGLKLIVTDLPLAFAGTVPFFIVQYPLAVIAALAGGIALILAVNHGPHNRRLVAPGHFDSERAFAAASLPDAYYAEYYARLVETAVTWNRLKSELS